MDRTRSYSSASGLFASFVKSNASRFGARRSKPGTVKARTRRMRWSRRINQEHRLVYQVLPDKIRILSCRFHY